MQSNHKLNNPEIVPVILAGGAGTRLWPLSRKSYPKQFSQLTNELSLFQQTVLRLSTSAQIKFLQPLTVTSADYRFIVSDQIAETNVNSGPILIEPSGKNTAAAILAASMHVLMENPNAILLVAPSDHVITNTNAFHQALLQGYPKAKQGMIVTLGIQPTRPETGYGYMELEERAENQSVNVKQFVEKPDHAAAEKMLQSQRYLWNAGIFMFQAENIIKDFEELAPNTYAWTKKALELGKVDLDFFRLDSQAWSELENLSFDYAIMENTQNIVAVPFKSHWSDLGEWDAVRVETNPDESGTVVSANATSIQCKNSLLRSESEKQHVVGLGLEDIIVVAMPDAVLVTKTDRTQDVKHAVSMLKEQNILQGEIFPKDHRPWGWFESLVLGGRFQVKRLMVKPGAALSLQSHHHRSEHWVVVEGTAKVTVDEASHLITEGESIFIPLGAKHRLENPGKLPMILIEIQTGPYLQEDDIIRYDDRYARS